MTLRERRELREDLDELIEAFGRENLEAGDLPEPVAPLAAHPNAPLNEALAAIDERYGPEMGYNTRVLVTHVETWTRREVAALLRSV